ncbi:ran-binding protein 3-like [Lineus longissimus]|uniref:ran-binding protein 3-like n=1 Tax=Lineus longissimus TaxID=88925 RepID=UPI00315C4FB9
MADTDAAKEVETPAISSGAGNSSSGSFVFGQNMSDRAVKKTDAPTKEDVKKENGTLSAARQEAKSPPSGSRPALFRPLTHLSHAPGHIGGFGASVVPPVAFAGSAASILAPNKLTSNPFATRIPLHHQMSGTPHTSDSEDEKKDKSIILPSHFKPSHKSKDHNNASPPSIVLRPSALSAQTQNLGKGMKSGFGSEKSDKDKLGSSFLLKPATLQSPFSKILDDMSHKNRESESTDTDNANCAKGDRDQKEYEKESDSDSSKENEKDETKEKDSNKSAAENFVSSATSKLPVSSPDSEKRTFVFGQKMEERAVSLADSSSCTSVTSSNDNSAANSNSASSSASFIFGQNLADRVTEGAEEKTPEETEKDSCRTLAESAKEYQAKHAQKEYDEVVVKTGEEDESNVLQANCKLFMYDHAAENWVEKGRGLLRLNDKNENNVLQSRIVMRTQGCLKVILNTKIWCGMMIEQASAKSLRITAQCDGAVKVFLIMANPKDTDHIFSAIDWRIQQLKVNEEMQPQKEEEEEEKPSKGGEKRPAEDNEDGRTSPENKRSRTDTRVDTFPDSGKRRDILREESNDSSAVDPETEVSYESSSSSPTIKSTSSD